MPWAPGRACRHPGCRNIVKGAGGPWCPEHKKLHDRLYNQTRDPALTKLYNSAAWRKARAEHLREHPYCAHCGRPAEQVHHVQPVREGGPLVGGPLVSLCRSCHARITAKTWRKPQG